MHQARAEVSSQWAMQINVHSASAPSWDWVPAAVCGAVCFTAGQYLKTFGVFYQPDPQ